jgi:predicted outer membrane repeat protein
MIQSPLSNRPAHVYMSRMFRLLIIVSGIIACPALRAVNVSEGSDFPNATAGAPYVLDFGTNTFSGSVSTPSDSQDRFDITVPAGRRIVLATKTFAAGGGIVSPNISFNTEDLSGTGAGTFASNYPLGSGTYSCIASVGFSVGNAWSITFTVEPVITWTTSTISGPADVSTTGTLVGAMNVGRFAAETVNGVTFAADPGGTGALALGAGTVQFSFENTHSDFMVETTIGGSTQYAAALDFGRWNDSPVSGTVTLGGLVAGRNYQVQLWISDSRPGSNNRNRTVDGITVNTGGPQIATSTFTAGAATQTISIAGVGGYGPQINLLQLREMAVLVRPAAITSSTSATDFFPVGQLIDGSGLSGTPTVANLGTHGAASLGNTAWVTESPAADYYTARPAPVLTCTLPSGRNITELVIWPYNFNAGAPVGNEAKTFDVAFSTDGVNFANTVTVTSPVPLVSNGLRLPLPGGPRLASHVRVTITDNHYLAAPGGDRVGLGEIRFVATPEIYVMNTADSGPGSLRQALADAAEKPGPDTIFIGPSFNGEVADTITLTGELAVNDTTGRVTIDASLVPGGVTLDGNNSTRLASVLAGASLTLKNLTLTRGNGNGGDGGAIYNAGTVAAEDCMFTANTATGNGGAIFSSNSVLTLTRCTVSGNTASYEGGGVRSFNAAFSATNCTFSGNTAVIGGALSTAGEASAAVLQHCTVAGNTATGISGFGGGGLFFYDKNAILTNCLIAGNTSQSGFGVDIQAFGSIFTLSGNIVGNNDTVTAIFPAGPLVGTPSAPLDARLAPLADNGGLTRTRALLPGSPALDAGVATATVTDQRGFERSRDGNAIAGALPDAGAYEAQHAPAPSIGFNFVGGGSGPGGTLAATDETGIFPQTNWNNLSTKYDGSSTGTAPNAASRSDSTGVTIPNLKLWWDAPNVWSRPGSPSTPNEKLLWGYLDSIGATNSGTNLYATQNQPFFSIAALPAAVSFGGYRVFLYSDGHDNDHVSEFWLTSNRGQNPGNVGAEIDLTTHRFRRDNTDGSTFTEVPASSTTYQGASTPIGNVVRFDTMTEPAFTVRSAETAYGTYTRVCINAVQIVRNEIIVVTTAADELDPVGTLGTGISLREAIALAPDGAGIVFDPAVFNGEPADTITYLTANPGLVLDKNLTIDASNIPGGVTINAAASSGNRKSVITVNATRTTSLLGLNLTGGYKTGFVGGGGLSNRGATTLTGCRLTGNTADYGAAATSYSGSGPTSLTLRRCTISNNTSTNQGCGLFNWAEVGNAADLRVEDSAVTGNTATGSGGGLYNYSVSGTATFTALRTTVTGNSGGFGAGCINLSNSGSAACIMTLSHCTVSGNTATTAGGGCHNRQLSGTSALTLAHTIVSGNTASSAANGPDIYKESGTITNAGGNLIGKNDTVAAEFPASALVGTSAAPVFPLLAPLGDYGGPTQTMALLPGSPARNAATGSTNTSDQRGYPILGTPDIGAYEAGTFTDFNAWVWETLPANATPAQRAPGFDYDGDGRTLLLEYAGQFSGTIGEYGNPMPFTSNAAGTLATLVMPYRYSTPDLIYTIERSTSLTGAWTTIITVFSGDNSYRRNDFSASLLTNDATTLTITDTFITGQPKVFYRLKVARK